MQLTDATLEKRASAARKIVHQSDDRVLLLSYVLWPDDETFGEVCRILRLVGARDEVAEEVCVAG